MSKVLLVLTNHLGNKVYNDTLFQLLKISAIDYEVIFLERTEGILRAPILDKLYCSYIVWKKYLKLKKKFDIIFFHGFELPFFFRGLKVKRILTTDATMDSAALINYSYLKKVYKGRIIAFIQRFLYKRVIKNFDYFIVRSSWCQEELSKRYKIPEEKISVSSNYLDLSVWKPISEDLKYKNTALLVGNNLKGKGGEFLIDVFKYSLKDYNLILVTTDIKEYELSPNIKILRNLNKAEVIDAYQKSNVFLFPSLFDKFGLVITEAMACGLPVIARNIGGGACLVSQGFNGIVLPRESSRLDWADSISRIFNETNIRIQMGINARKYAEDNFSLEKNLKVLEIAFKSCGVI